MPTVRCLIAAETIHAALAERVLTLISSLGQERFSAEIRVGPISDDDAEFLIPIVDASNYARIREEITTLRHGGAHSNVLLLSAGLPRQNMLELLACGAFDFVGEPFNDEEFRVRLFRAAGLLPTPRPVPVRRLLSSKLHDLVGNSPAFLKVLSTLPVIAGCDAGVLILGETGTGKELCARAVHYLSARNSKPWVAVNCGAIPNELVESELFGHVRGAFTNAHASRTGLIQEAEGGALFLDEIDSMPFGAQCKLLRFLQDKGYRPVGSSTTAWADVRVVAASNQNLNALAAVGRFRQDLFFRLSVLQLTLPPLRERREDIPVLVAHFLDHFSQRDKRPARRCSPAALRKLIDYGWPGNVRELKHVLERAVLMSSCAVLQVEDFDMPASPGLDDTCPIDADSFRAAKARVVESFERHYIERLLTMCDGNVTRAALAAKKDRRAFFELMRKHGIHSHQFRGADNAPL
ncbi:sigma-54 interaction domain-containing protein [Paraburkholderia sp. BR14374]|uniref:sigma-54 interaction domain-containing protein n=1 Tax=Paraburkholderia sp. BR14374 TaxID=3237007 RepID=UPI0034CF0B1B